MRSPINFTFSLIALSFAAVAAQPVPRGGWDGYWLGGGGPGAAHLELFGDFICPDTKASWPTMKQVIAHYGDRLAFGFHRFPLPYHHNAFYAAQGAHVVNSLPRTSSTSSHKDGHSRVWEWVDAFFGDAYPNQANFTNGATADVTQNGVITKLAAVATAIVGMPAADFVKGMTYDDDFDEATRASWKYGCSRGISGTPSFMLNGVVVDGQPDWALADWVKLIDPLL